MLTATQIAILAQLHAAHPVLLLLFYARAVAALDTTTVAYILENYAHMYEESTQQDMRELACNMQLLAEHATARPSNTTLH